MKLPTVKSPIQVRFTDLDQLGHVSNSVYPQYLDMGRIDLYFAIEAELEKHEPKVEQPVNVVASLKIDYLAEVTMEDEVHITTWCTDIGTKSMTLQQEVIAGDKCAARATVVLVAVNPETKASIAYPQDWEPAA